MTIMHESNRGQAARISSLNDTQTRAFGIEMIHL